MYVKHYASDNSGVDEEIAKQLRGKGLTVTTGPAAAAGNVDAIVTYVDKWWWDITMYMLELTVTIHDPKTEAPIATGNSLHSSLTRKSQAEMVEEVINNIFNSSGAATEKNSLPTAAHNEVQGNASAQTAPSR